MMNGELIQVGGTKKNIERFEITFVEVVKMELLINKVTKSMTLDRIEKEYIWSTLNSLLRIHSQPENFETKADYCI